MKVIFLDIDGVLQAYSAQERFNHDLKQMAKDLTEKYHIDYNMYNWYDVGACYYDWDPDAVNRIKEIINKTGAKIVISSDWRTVADLADPDNKYPNKMRDFLKLWDMEQYWVGETDFFYKENKLKMKDAESYITQKYGTDGYFFERTVEIQYYLDQHPEITNYVIIDDRKFYNEKHYVKTYNLINDEQKERCIQILNDPSLENDNRKE